MPPAMPSFAAPIAPRAGHGPLIAGIAGAVVLLGAGGAFAAWQGWLPFLQKPPTVQDVLASMDAVKSARLQTTITAKMEPRDANVTPIDLTAGTPPADASAPSADTAAMTTGIEKAVIEAIPSSFDLTTTVKTLVQSSGDANADVDGETTVDGAWKSNGLTAEFSVAAKQAKGTTYVQINSLPIPLIDVASVANQWIEFPKGVKNVGDLFTYEDPKIKVFDKTAAKPADPKPDVSANEDARALLAEAFNAGGIAVTSMDGKGQADGRPAWHLTLAFDADKLQAAIDARCAARAGKTHAVLTDDFCKKPTAEDAARTRQFVKNLTGEAWVDKKDNVPTHVVLNLKFALASEAPKLADKQIHVAVDLALSNVNQPNVVQAPDKTIPMDRALQMVSGQSAATVTLSNQEKIVDDLRKALDAYQAKNKTYPPSLQALIGTTQNYGDSEPVSNIPLDQYTGAAFPYVSTGDDYALTYSVKLPAPDTSAGALSGLLTLGPKYADGVNTATHWAVSKEALSKLDDDKDGLNNYDEIVHGTDPNKADTDGDGFTDKQEVDSKHDPLKNGKTGKVFPRVSPTDISF